MPADHRKVLLITLVGAVALGAVDLLLQKVLPYPWVGLANSSAVWALAAYGLGMWVRTPWWRAAGAGALLLVVAVPAYYLTAAWALGDSVSALWQPPALWWMGFGLLAGAIFGFGASLVYSGGWQQVAGKALPGAVMFAEALIFWMRAAGADSSYAYVRLDRQIALIDAAVGVLVILLVARRQKQRALALAAAVPLALIGYVAFKLGGF